MSWGRAIPSYELFVFWESLGKLGIISIPWASTAKCGVLTWCLIAVFPTLLSRSSGTPPAYTTPSPWGAASTCHVLSGFRMLEAQGRPRLLKSVSPKLSGKVIFVSCGLHGCFLRGGGGGGLQNHPVQWLHSCPPQSYSWEHRWMENQCRSVHNQQLPWSLAPGLLSVPSLLAGRNILSVFREGKTSTAICLGGQGVARWREADQGIFQERKWEEVSFSLSLTGAQEVCLSGAGWGGAGTGVEAAAAEPCEV